MPVFIVISDLGYNSPKSPVPTPFIDQLARGPGAVSFSQYYVHSLCTPSRASLMTGRYHVNTGLTNVLVPGTPIGLPANIQTLPEALKELAGYKTAMSGKW
jgi:arylsulfatase A-like enzyme